MCANRPGAPTPSNISRDCRRNTPCAKPLIIARHPHPAAWPAAASQPPAPEQSPAGVEDAQPERRDRRHRHDDAGHQRQHRSVQPGRTQGSEEPAVQAQRLLRSRQYVVKDEFKPLIEAHAKFLVKNPTDEDAHPGQCRRARQPRIQPCAWPEARRSDQEGALPCSAPAKSSSNPSASARKSRACTDQTEACWAQNRRGDMLYSGEF